MERPNINDYFRMVGGDCHEGYLCSHKVIQILTAYQDAWLKYELSLQEKILAEMNDAMELRKKLSNLMDALLR